MSQHRTQFGLGMLAATFAITAAMPAFAAPTTDWPAFRGPHGDGVATATSVFPASGDISLSVAWKVPIGSGYSGIAVADGVAVTMFAAGKSDVIAAFDMKTGAERWRYVMDESYIGHDGSHTGPIATPFIGGGRVYALTPRGKLFALNVATGAPAWTVDLVKDHEATKPHYGFSTSPFVRQGVLIVQGGAKKAAVTGFDPKTGKLLWKAGEDDVGYQSPADYTVSGKAVMLAPGNNKLMAVEPRTGKVVWEFAHGGNGATGAGSMSPVAVGGDKIFLSNQGSSGSLFSVRDASGSIKADKVWESKSVRNSYNCPAFFDGHIYAYSSRFLTCVDPATGDAIWKSRKPGDGFLIVVDGHLVIVTKKDGGLFISKASADGYSQIAGTQVFDEGVWAHPSFADGSIFVRSLGELARVNINRGGAVASAKPHADFSAGSGRLAKFLKKVATAGNKKATVDSFMASIRSFPLVDGNKIHFLYRGKGNDLAVGSDLYGARQERSMTRVDGTDLFYLTANVELNARADYVFIRDFEDHITDSMNQRKTKGSIYGHEMAMNFGGPPMEMSWFAMPQWKAPTFFATPDKAREGKIEKREFKSEVLGNATVEVDVYLPASYAKGSDRYPVAYVHGGAAAMEKGEMPRALDNLIDREVKPVIVVFIKPSGRIAPDKYADMFASDLIPFLDKSFRTIASREARASIGAGFQGAAALGLAFAMSDMIGKAAALSPFMFDAKAVTSLIKTPKEQPIELFIEWAKYDLRSTDEAWDLAQTSRDFVALLKERGFDPQGGEMNEGTGWSSWKNRTGVVFTALFPKG